MSTSDSQVTDVVAQEAHGSILAQDVIDGLHDDRLSAGHAWLAFIQLTGKHGWRSAACRAYVNELAKRAANG